MKHPVHRLRRTTPYAKGDPPGIRIQSGLRWAHRLRACLLALGMLTAYIGVGAKLIALQALQHEPLLAEAVRTRRHAQETEARRGHILDRNGRTLAISGVARTLCADPARLGSEEAARWAEVLASVLEVDRGILLDRFTSGKRFVYVKRRMSAAETERVLELRLPPGVFFTQEEAVREYPQGVSMSHVLGFVDHRHEGVEGVELKQDGYLRGLGGFVVTEQDRLRREMLPQRGAYVEPRNGCSVVLTVDAAIQHIVETELQKGIEDHGANWGCAVLTDPRTGEILALANLPTFDPNDPGAAPPEARRNRAVTDRYEPGSTFKVVVVAAALNEGIVRLDQQFDCENGRFLYNRRILHDHHSYGLLTVEDILVKSSNIGAAKIGLRLGPQRLYDYVRRFGFGAPTGIDLPLEARGIVHPVNRWSAISITRIPMGHEVDATPLQVVGAFGAIANGGVLMEPRIVRELHGPDGRLLRSYPPRPVRRVVDEGAARAMLRPLMRVVSAEGTAPDAAIPGYEVAGKTGTTQKLIDGQYSRTRHIASFVGFAPAREPVVCGIVVLDEPRTSMYGGKTAAPVFREIMDQVLKYLGVPPVRDDLRLALGWGEDTT